jgi:hypothetical protein
VYHVVPNGIKEIRKVYGNPVGPVSGKVNPTWYANNITTMPLPYTMYLAWDKDNVVRNIQVHRLVVDDLTDILKEIYKQTRIEVKMKYGFDGYDTAFYDMKTAALLRYYGLDLYGGAYNYRLKRGGSSLSVHSWGVAIDLDPERNGMGDTTPAMPSFAVKIFEEKGWVWGGRWKGRGCDGMHFQRCEGY